MDSLVQSTCTPGAAKATLRCIYVTFVLLQWIVTAVVCLWLVFAASYLSSLLVVCMYVVATGIPTTFPAVFHDDVSPIDMRSAKVVCGVAFIIALPLSMVWLQWVLEAYVRRTEKTADPKKD
jgi:hypothetical protein